MSERPTKEEEDTTNWLILLAGGGYNPKLNEIVEATIAVNITSERVAEPTISTTGKVLGGHRASHNKKPKLSNPLASGVMNEYLLSSLAKVKVKSHKCSVYNNEFSSGHALGGHMRKHYQPITP
ncbi:zinc finger protein ZAT5-like [Phalaenopsis equestris]|uniref:zinc finger protein ZAT5-like n=1 Tax=Phalaenopsis equestris TaxID=78828 RepID=UPI0009E41765|nr:zinc finger protein ZAT5-like [Phalaenopsis equestris]